MAKAAIDTHTCTQRHTLLVCIAMLTHRDSSSSCLTSLLSAPCLTAPCCRQGLHSPGTVWAGLTGNGSGSSPPVLERRDHNLTGCGQAWSPHLDFWPNLVEICLCRPVGGGEFLPMVAKLCDPVVTL